MDQTIRDAMYAAGIMRPHEEPADSDDRCEAFAEELIGEGDGLGDFLAEHAVPGRVLGQFVVAALDFARMSADAIANRDPRLLAHYQAAADRAANLMREQAPGVEAALEGEVVGSGYAARALRAGGL